MRTVKIHKCEQGSDEWFAVKLGKVSASHFSEVLNKKAGRKTYMYRLLGERLSGESYEGYSNKIIERGTVVEHDARAYYEALHGKIEQVGFVELNDYVGCSPDGLVGLDGLVEIKCPQPNTHIKYIDKNKMPTEYYAQVQGNLWVTGRKWCDFISFVPQVKSKPFWMIRVQRDEEYIATLAVAVETFISEMKELEARITNKNLNF